MTYDQKLKDQKIKKLKKQVSTLKSILLDLELELATQQITDLSGPGWQESIKQFNKGQLK
jgi:ribosomal protein L29